MRLATSGSSEEDLRGEGVEGKERRDDILRARWASAVMLCDALSVARGEMGEEFRRLVDAEMEGIVGEGVEGEREGLFVSDILIPLDGWSACGET